MVRWLESHTGVIVAIAFTAVAVGGVLVSIIGYAIDNNALGENGWVLSLMALMFGLAVRAGYNMGRRTGVHHLEAEITELRSQTESFDAQMVAIHTTIVDIRDMVASLDPRVRPFPSRGRE